MFSCLICYFLFFFFHATATTEIYTLSLHDALPIYVKNRQPAGAIFIDQRKGRRMHALARAEPRRDSAHELRFASAEVSFRSEEHTSELQSQSNLVCRLLLEKKKKNKKT